MVTLKSFDIFQKKLCKPTKGYQQLTKTVTSTLYFYENKLKDKSVKCYYNYAITDHVDFAAKVKLHRKRYPITSYATVLNHTVIVVNCKKGNKKIYRQVHYLFPKDKIKVQPRFHTSTNPKYNVLVFGTDSISRLNLHRSMPKTLNLLKKLGAIEYLSYNKVGDNTKPNLFPAFSGLHYSEMVKDSCYSSGKPSFFDKCRFTWDEFKDQGYVTSYAEV